MAEAAGSERLSAVRRVLAWLVISQVVLLVLTGAYLFVAYRPTSAQAWPILPEGSDGQGQTLVDAVRSMHAWLGWTTVLSGLVLSVASFSESMIRWRGTDRRRSGVLTGPVMAVVLLVAIVTGFLLPWDQLALRAVTVGSDVRGYGWIFGDDVRFVLRSGLEVSVSTVRWLVAIHAAIIPLVLAVVLGATLRSDNKRQRSS